MSRNVADLDDHISYVTRALELWPEAEETKLRAHHSEALAQVREYRHLLGLLHLHNVSDMGRALEGCITNGDHHEDHLRAVKGALPAMLLFVDFPPHQYFLFFSHLCITLFDLSHDITDLDDSISYTTQALGSWPELEDTEERAQVSQGLAQLRIRR